MTGALPERMRAVVLTGHGGLDKLEYREDWPVPKPSGSWGSASVNVPRIKGADVAGVIAAVGTGVGPARVGERVTIDPWPLGNIVTVT